jgi:rRNA-processing protein FCF1
MAESDQIIVDANILFSALQRGFDRFYELE